MTTTRKASRETAVKAPRKPATRPAAVEPMGITEMAARINVATDTIQKWRLRFADTDAPFPESRGTVSGQPWWHWGDVARWLKRTGRG